MFVKGSFAGTERVWLTANAAGGACGMDAPMVENAWNVQDMSRIVEKDVSPALLHVFALASEGELLLKSIVGAASS